MQAQLSTRSKHDNGRRPTRGSRTEQFSNLSVSSLTEDQHKNTCGYWYIVTAGAMSHTAFADRDHLIRWMEDRGLSLLGELAMAGTNSTVGIDGTYRRTSHLSYDECYSLSFGSASPGEKRVRICDNAEYTLGIIAEDEDGIANVHYMNCNMRDRMVFDYATSRALVG